MDNSTADKTKRVIGDTVYYVRTGVKFNDKRYHRRALKMKFINQGESLQDLIIKYIEPMYEEDDIVAISKKVVSMCQNDVQQKKDIKIGTWAKILNHISSKVLSKDIIGTGTDSEYKFQVLINEAGIYNVLRGYILEALGHKGALSRLINEKIYTTNVFNEFSPFEIYRDLAILNPKEADKICNKIYDNTGVMCMVAGANIHGGEVLAKCDALLWHSYDSLSEFVKDNPFGKPDDLTPFVIMKPLREDEDDDYPYDDENSGGEELKTEKDLKADSKEESNGGIEEEDLDEEELDEEELDEEELDEEELDEEELDEEELDEEELDEEELDEEE